MKMQISRRWFFAGLVYGLALLGFLTQAWGGVAQQYVLTPIGPADNDPFDSFGPIRGNWPIAEAISPDGETVVGDTYLGSDYNQAVQFTPIAGPLAGAVSGAFDVEAGRIVGFVEDRSTFLPGNYPPRAAVWENGSVRLLEQLPEGRLPRNHSLATCVNSAGDIWGAGVSRDYWHPPQGPDPYAVVLPVEWVGGDILVELPTLGGPKGSVNTCNDGGDSAGWSMREDGASHCTYWTAWGGVHDCHPQHGTSSSAAAALNNRGLLAGNAVQYGRTFGYLWWWPGIRWLMPLAGDTSSQVFGLNENGVTVGQSCQTPDHWPCRAVAWEQGQAVELLGRVRNGENWTLYEAKAISDDGMIVANGEFQVGTQYGRPLYVQHAVMLTPVETPTDKYFAWKARIYNWYVQQYQLKMAHLAHQRYGR